MLKLPTASRRSNGATRARPRLFCATESKFGARVSRVWGEDACVGAEMEKAIRRNGYGGARKVLEEQGLGAAHGDAGVKQDLERAEKGLGHGGGENEREREWGKRARVSSSHGGRRSGGGEGPKGGTGVKRGVLGRVYILMGRVALRSIRFRVGLRTRVIQ